MLPPAFTTSLFRSRASNELGSALLSRVAPTASCWSFRALIVDALSGWGWDQFRPAVSVARAFMDSLFHGGRGPSLRNAGRPTTGATGTSLAALAATLDARSGARGSIGTRGEGWSGATRAKGRWPKPAPPPRFRCAPLSWYGGGGRGWAPNAVVGTPAGTRLAAAAAASARDWADAATAWRLHEGTGSSSGDESNTEMRPGLCRPGLAAAVPCTPCTLRASPCPTFMAHRCCHGTAPSPPCPAPVPECGTDQCQRGGGMLSSRELRGGTCMGGAAAVPPPGV